MKGVGKPAGAPGEEASVRNKAETARGEVAGKNPSAEPGRPMSGQTLRLAIVGLGLIGGSFAKAARAANARAGRKLYEVLGLDRDQSVLAAALGEGVCDKSLEDFSEADLTVLALPPDALRAFLSQNTQKFTPDTLVIDVCGVKESVCAFVRTLPGRKFSFFGCHPMAGREVSGYAASLPTLFHRASFILTRAEGLGQTGQGQATIEELAENLGFARTVVCSPEAHDREIAFTSQLCHLVSSAYVKSPALPESVGFTAGSFRDLSRVAYLDEDLWTSLFLENRDALLSEADAMIAHLSQYREALAGRDEEGLRKLLREGRALAAQIRSRR